MSSPLLRCASSSTRRHLPRTPSTRSPTSHLRHTQAFTGEKFEEPAKPAHWQSLAATTLLPCFPRAMRQHSLRATAAGAPAVLHLVSILILGFLPVFSSHSAGAAIRGHVFDVVLFAGTDGEGEETEVTEGISFRFCEVARGWLRGIGESQECRK